MLIKRIFDFMASLIGIIILLPFFAMIAILIKLDSKGPVLFIQTRAGKDGKPFRVYKFRTMVKNAEEKGPGYFVEKNDSRITRVGSFLRKYSLDELPQLINVLKGEMSLVGPRPTLMYQVEEYDDYQWRRLEVKPGITGWAQVNGRNELTWPEKIKHDVWYVDNRSFWLDLKIIFMTFRVVFTDKIYADESFDESEL